MVVLRRKDGDSRRPPFKLQASHAGIHVENHVPLLHRCVRDFLRTGQPVGESNCFDRANVYA